MAFKGQSRSFVRQDGIWNCRQGVLDGVERAAIR